MVFVKNFKFLQNYIFGLDTPENNYMLILNRKEGC